MHAFATCHAYHWQKYIHPYALATLATPQPAQHRLRLQTTSCHRLQAPSTSDWLLWCVHGAEQECSAGRACAAVPHLGALDSCRTAQPAAVLAAGQERGTVEGGGAQQHSSEMCMNCIVLRLGAVTLYTAAGLLRRSDAGTNKPPQQQQQQQLCLNTLVCLNTLEWLALCCLLVRTTGGPLAAVYVHLSSF
jgi:hypothetical protein